MSKKIISQTHVFISWTKDDEIVKEQICNMLDEADIAYIESKNQCVGQFEDWSEAVPSEAHIFLVLASKNVSQNSLVRNEIREALFMEDAPNRILPVIDSLQSKLYNESFSKENKDISLLKADELKDSSLREQKISAVCNENWIFTQDILEEILNKIKILLMYRLVKIYKANTSIRMYMDIVPLLSGMRSSKDIKEIYVDQSLIRTKEDGSLIEEISDFEDILTTENISYIYGEGGCGKTSFIKNLFKKVQDERVILLLKCSKASISEESIFNILYGEFKRQCGDLTFCTETAFQSILKNYQFIIVFDGIDEIIKEESTKKLIDKIKDYYEHAYVNSMKRPKMIFTGRRLADADKLSFFYNATQVDIARYELQKFDNAQMKKLIDNLFLAFLDKEKGNRFYVALSSIDYELKSNPLILTQLAIVYNEEEIIPETILEVFDKLIEILLKNDQLNKEIYVKKEYAEIVEPENLKEILKQFAMKRYLFSSKGKDLENRDIFQLVLQDFKETENYTFPLRSGVVFLEEYLMKRSILIENEFYHKMLLEYFTAVGYFESIYNGFEINKNNLKEFFKYYNDNSWRAVLEMFLIKADNKLFKSELKELYEYILEDEKIIDYTLLFDACEKLIKQKQYIQLILIKDILIKSTSGVFPPYGPLFYYVPQYKLFESSIYALNEQELKGNAKVLALVRDACFIYGLYNNVKEITNEIDGTALFAAAKRDLSGVRKALCEIFYLGDTNYIGGNDIYPRCFNVQEAKHLRDYGCGILGRMQYPFEDELHLFNNSQKNKMNNEYVGFVSFQNYKESVESELQQFKHKKLTCISFTLTQSREFNIYRFYRRSIKQIYINENCIGISDYYKDFDTVRDIVVLRNGIRYINPKIKVPIESISRDSGFENCQNLEEAIFLNPIPYNNSLGNNLFRGCRNLVEVILPSNLEHIGIGSFAGCENLIKLQIPNSIKTIGIGAFRGCKKLPELALPQNLENILFDAFENCENLNRIVIPDRVERIESGAFRGCRNLKEVILPDNLREIGSSVFENCENLNRIVIPDRVERIESGAFRGCRNLIEIELPHNLKYIWSEAFAECQSLSKLIIPKSISNMGYNIFKNCYKLKKIEIPEDFQNKIGWLGLNPQTCDIKFYNQTKSNTFKKSTIKKNDLIEGVEWIEDEMFAYATDLKEIILPSTLKEIGICAFKSCIHLEKINIPMNVISIGNQAFCDCINLKEVNLPQSIKYIWSEAFAHCIKLSKITIPSQIQEIEPETFLGCTNLTHAILPQSLECICSRAFANCTKIREIEIPENVMKLEREVFLNCSSLRTIKLPLYIREIMEGVFEGCESLEKIELPSRINEIGKKSFFRCKSLKKITFSSQLKKIRSYAFAYCESLEKIIIPSDVTEIEDSSFLGCKNLKEVILPENLLSLGFNTFKDCVSLFQIELPMSLRIIEDNVFLNCSNIKKIRISANFENDIERIFGKIDGSIIEWID